MMSIKLDTNALERLMSEDDGTIKLELQQAVIEEFSRRRIKAHINDGNFQKAIGTEIEKHFGTWIKGNYGRIDGFKFNPEIKKIFKEEADKILQSEISELRSYISASYKEAEAQLKNNLAAYNAQLLKDTEKIKEQLLNVL